MLCFSFLSIILLIDNTQLVSGQCASAACDGFASQSSFAFQYYETDGIEQLIYQAAETKADVTKLLTICQNVSTEIDKIDKQQQDASKSLSRQLNQAIIQGTCQNLSSRIEAMEMMHRNSSTAIIDRLERQQQDATSRLARQLNENQLISQSRHQNLSSRIESISGRFDTLSSSISRTLEVYEQKMETLHRRLSFAMERFYNNFQLTTSQTSYDVRLVNQYFTQYKQSVGRLEVLYNDVWGTVCDDGFTDDVARVVCASLGYGDRGKFIRNAFGPGTGPIWLSNVTCDGSETDITSCEHSPWGVSINCSHSNDVSITCGVSWNQTSENPQFSDGVRLVGSTSRLPVPTDGRLEILYLGVWGSVCYDDYYGYSYALGRVVCARLGFGRDVVNVWNSYESSPGPIWLSNVYCSGDESDIAGCSHSPWGAYTSCNYGVRIKCRYNPKYSENIRLVNSNPSLYNQSAGRLEVMYETTWGSVCDPGFSDAAARVVCARLGFGRTGRFVRNAFGTAWRRMWLSDVICDGNETDIASCRHSDWGSTYYCSNYQEVSVICEEYNSLDLDHVRLVNPSSEQSNPSAGLLEIKYFGIWGTVCDDKFTDAAARVICTRLGFGNTGKFVWNAFGPGTGPIWLSNVTCNGSETDVASCGHSSWGVTTNCSHSNDVSISCGYNSLDADHVRLINPRSAQSNQSTGRLEIEYYGTWGTVCDDEFTDAAARVICTRLGFGNTGKFVRNVFGPGTGPIWLSKVTCNGSETDITSCGHSPWGLTTNCSHSNDVSIICGHNNSLDSGRVRLVNSRSVQSNQSAGRLEINYFGTWGTVCDVEFTDAAARVICTMLGFGNTGKFVRTAFGPGTGPIWLSEVTCYGSETDITSCGHSPWGVTTNCQHSNDVSIICGVTWNQTSENPQFSDGVRLVGSNSRLPVPKDGRLEILYLGVWGSVCYSGFSYAAGRVVCARLGYGRDVVNVWNSYAYTHYSRGPKWLSYVYCSGNESDIAGCSHSPWGAYSSCYYGVGIKCRYNPKYSENIRLVNSNPSLYNQSAGRLEVMYETTWGTVCDRGFTDAAARVVCARLGFGQTGRFVRNAFGIGSGTIWLSDVICDGNETDIASCRHSDWGSSYYGCSHNRDVSVICEEYNSLDVDHVRLVNPGSGQSNQSAGRLEIKYFGTWGTVCDDEFTDAAARVICTRLGFGNTGKFARNAFGPGTGPIWLSNVTCNGSETDITSCAHSPWGVTTNCSHSNDVSISCDE